MLYEVITRFHRRWVSFPVLEDHKDVGCFPLLKATKEFDISLEGSFMISDRYKDMQFAYNNHIKSIMVMTGYGLGARPQSPEAWRSERLF